MIKRAIAVAIFSGLLFGCASPGIDGTTSSGAGHPIIVLQDQRAETANLLSSDRSLLAERKSQLAAERDEKRIAALKAEIEELEERIAELEKKLEEINAALVNEQRKPATTSYQPAYSSTHVGPRGGVYTYTKSGKKRYIRRK